MWEKGYLCGSVRFLNGQNFIFRSSSKVYSAVRMFCIDENLAKFISLVVQIHLAIANCFSKLCLTDSV